VLPALRAWDFRGHQGQVRSSWDLGRRLSLDLGVSAASALREPTVTPLLRADVRLAWSAAENAEWSLGVQDVLRGSALEFFGEGGVRSSQSGRAVYLKFTWGR
jgi:hypothetical protein